MLFVLEFVKLRLAICIILFFTEKIFICIIFLIYLPIIIFFALFVKLYSKYPEDIIVVEQNDNKYISWYSVDKLIKK